LSRTQSRDIGKYLQRSLQVDCAKYPTIKILRSSPPGRWELVWTFRQLADCYNITNAYHVEMRNVTVQDLSGPYKVDYLSIVMMRVNGGWSDPIIVPDVEEITPKLDLQEISKRGNRLAQRARDAILSLAGIVQSVSRPS
jgi:hypothetical protein